MERTSIFDCQMRAFYAAWSSEKRRAIGAAIERYVVHYSITHIAIKIPTFSVKAPAVLEVLKDIKALCKAEHIPFSTHSLADVKKNWCGTHRVAKRALMQRILKTYPELQREYDKEKKNKVKYYEKIFEAVAVAAER